MENLLETLFYRKISAYKLQKVVVAFSGGADSTALLLLFHKFAATDGIQLQAAHFNHQWRESATIDQQFCQNLCQQLGVPLTIGFAQDYSCRDFGSAEANARAKRHQFFAQFTDCVIAMAHHRDDQLENFFIKLIRGCSFEGASKIAELTKVGQLEIFRPLLDFTKTDLVEYLRDNKTGFVEDPTNLDNKYLRNKIRNCLLPKLTECDQRVGKNILNSGFDLDLYVQIGAGAYICGEETALLESLEGKRGNPRIKPPFPAIAGLYGCPTVVNNVETIAAVVPIVSEGGAAYAAVGIGNSKGTKLISASGHINKPGVYEIELGVPVEEFIYSDEYCGGIRNGKKLKAVVAGGSSVPILPTELILNTAAGEPRLMSYESLADGGFTTGTMLGSGGFIVMDEDTSIVKNLYTFARFYHHESCGQCSPCREGTGWMEKILHKILHGHGTLADVDLLWDIQSKIEGKTICPLGEAAAWPVAAAIRHFRKEFEDFIRNGEHVNDVKHYYRLNNLTAPIN